MTILAAYTSPEIVVIVGALGGLAVTVGGVITSVIISLKNSGKIDKVDAKVNGAATASTTEIKTLQTQIASLVAEAAAKKEIASLLAAHAAAAAVQSSTVTVANTPENPVPVLPTP